MYDNVMFHSLLYFRSSLSIVSVIFTLGILTIIVLFKKYKFFTQRLIIYLAISTLSYQIVSAADVTSIRAYSDKTAMNYCIFIGFMSQVVGWWPVLATTVIALDIFIRIVLKKSTERLEILYVLLIFVSPLITGWIPFIDSSFGPSQYFCWIRSEDEDCFEPYTVGTIYRTVLFVAPYYFVVMLMVILLLITAVFLWQFKRQFSGKFDPTAVVLRNKMQQEIRPILYYPIIFITTAVISLPTVLTGSAAAKDPIVYTVFAVLLSIVYRLDGVFITVVFALDPETRKKLNVKDITAAARSFFEKEKTTDYDARYSTRSDSFYVSVKNTEGKE